MSKRQFSILDRVLIEVETGLNTVFGQQSANRATPGNTLPEDELSSTEKKASAGYMRVNHCGEVCAQALYRGQLCLAKSPETQTMLQHACDEEIDHLAWTHERLQQLNSHRSYLNAFFYTHSFFIGLVAAAISDAYSLGFVEETEKQVGEHLQSHLKKLPEQDLKSRAIVEQMAVDEAEHGAAAKQAGGKALPAWIQCLMKLNSKVMTNSTYYL